MSKEGLEVIARMTDSKIQIRDIIEKFILLTYDLPNTEEGDKARFEFLAQARAIGAVQHTESVYLMPWSKEAEALALSLSKTKGGKVVVWSQAELADPEQRKQVTAQYDNSLKPLLREISERLDRMFFYKHKGRQKLVIRMTAKTQLLLEQAEAVSARRGSEVIQLWLELIKVRFAKL